MYIQWFYKPIRRTSYVLLCCSESSSLILCSNSALSRLSVSNDTNELNYYYTDCSIALY